MRPLPNRPSAGAAPPSDPPSVRVCPTDLEALDDRSLLGLLLARSLPDTTVDAVAAALIARFATLGDIAAAPTTELGRTHGMGTAAILDLKLVREICIRLSRSAACERPVLSSWDALVAYCRTTLASLPREPFRTLYLDRRNILLRDELVAEGSVDHAPVYNAGPSRVERLGRVPRITETEHYVDTVIECYLALTAGRRPLSAIACRTPGRAR